MDLNSLNADKNKLEAILSAIGEGIIIIDLKKKIIYQNDKAYEMFGDFVDKNCFSIYHHGDIPCEDCPAALCIKHDMVKNAIHSRIDADGNLHYYELTVAPVKENKKVVASVEIIRDITERKILEEELTRTTRRLQTVISKMRYGLLYTNRRDEVAIGNNIALDFFSVKLNEKLDSVERKTDKANKKVLRRVIEAFKNDDNVNYYEKKIPDGDYWYNLGFSASRSSTGKYYGTIVNITDITNIKKLEELKENLTHMIVHDMKNPLNTILYVLEMAAKGMIENLDPAGRKLFKIAYKDSKILLNMIQGMLDISKMEEGEGILNKKESDYKNIIKKSISEVGFLAKARDVNIKEIYSTEMVVLEVDEDYLERVIVNLLANAIKFAKSNSEILVLITDYKQKGNKYIKISVVNESAKNIPKSALKTIFDKYKQAEHRVSGRIASTGLGLTFCKLAVESHGGKIWVTSPPEEYKKGASFSFTIPIGD